jgi:hypothetical protein
MNYLHSPFTATERDEADEFHDVERMNRWFPALGWAIGVVAVFGCMLAGWFAS